MLFSQCPVFNQQRLQLKMNDFNQRWVQRNWKIQKEFYREPLQKCNSVMPENISFLKDFFRFAGISGNLLFFRYIIKSLTQQHYSLM